MGKKKAEAQGTARSAFERLSPKHKVFVTEFMTDFNATQAYIRAGYSANGLPRVPAAVSLAPGAT